MSCHGARGYKDGDGGLGILDFGFWILDCFTSFDLDDFTQTFLRYM